MNIRLNHPWLIVDFGKPLRVLSWAFHRPGFVTADKIVWREVRNADLPEEVDAARWFKTELEDAGHSTAVGLLTSRDISRFTHVRLLRSDVLVEALATVGLSNAIRVGNEGVVSHRAAGTINIAVSVSIGLSEAAQIEALTIAAQARTVAVMTHGPAFASGRATGTGTDCIAIAASPGEIAHAGLHTAVGQAVGAAVLDAVTRGVQDWMVEQSYHQDR